MNLCRRRAQDVRLTEIDKVEIAGCFRPGDIVKAEVRTATAAFLPLYPPPRYAACCAISIARQNPVQAPLG